MKQFLGSTKFKASLIPIVIIVVFASVLVTTILNQEQQLPSKGWSRGIELNSTLSSANDYPLISAGNGNYHIYTKSDESVNEIVLNNKLKIEKKTTIPVKVPYYSQFWTDGKQVVFVKKNNLIKTLDGRSAVLAQNVDGMTPYGQDLIFWKSNQLFEWDATSQQIKKLVQTPQPIDSVVTKSGTNYLLIVSQVVNEQWVYLGVVALKDGRHYYPIDRVNQPYNATLDDFDFVAHQNSMHVVYSEYGSTTGGMYRRNYLEAFNLKNYKKEQPTELLNIKNAHDNLTFLLPTNIRINWIDGGLALVFQEQSNLFRGEDAQNIFLAKKQRNTWIAEPISSSVEPSSSPIWLTSQSVLWNDHIGTHYTLMLGTQNAQLIQKSKDITQKDWGNAISQALMNLTVSLLMVAYALLWVIPTLVFMVVMFIGNMTTMERNPNWVKVVGVLLFIITQLLFIKGLFNPTFYRYSPGFLQFPGNWFIIPVILAIVSWFLTEWGKGKEWGNSLFIFYCCLIDVLMLGFLIGPYTI